MKQPESEAADLQNSARTKIPFSHWDPQKLECDHSWEEVRYFDRAKYLHVYS